MDEAEGILQRIRAAGFRTHAIAGDGHWFLFAYRDGREFSVRADSHLRAVRALAIAVGLDDPDVGEASRAT